jgi:hypothetical protein
MKLVVYNGSPRAKKSNTKLLLENFLKGYTTICKTDFEMYYLMQETKTDKHVELFGQAENVIVAFPLYTDAMPGIVKHFFEALEPYKNSDDNPDISFIIHSGFPEPHHCRYLEKYLEKLAGRLKCRYKGTVIKAGTEGYAIMPSWMTKKVYKKFFDLGVHFGNTTEMHPEIIKKLASKDHNSKGKVWFMKKMQHSSMFNFYWNKQLKENNAMSKKDDQPYLAGKN